MPLHQSEHSHHRAHIHNTALSIQNSVSRSWQCWFVSLVLAILGTCVLVINSTTQDDYQSGQSLFDTAISTSASQQLLRFITFCALFTALYFFIPDWFLASHRARLLSLAVSALLSWTWTVPGSPSDNYDWSDFGPHAWKSSRLLIFFGAKWLILTVVMTIIVTAFNRRFEDDSFFQQTLINQSFRQHAFRFATMRQVLQRCADSVLGLIDFDFAHISRLASIILLFWLPILPINSPAQVFVDTIGEILMFRTPSTIPLPGFRNPGVWIDGQHPPFDTLIFGMVDNIGRTFGNELLAFSILIWIQTIALAFAVSLMVSWIKTRTKTPRILQLFILVVIFCGGLFPLTSCVVMKDSLWFPFFIAWIVAFAETTKHVWDGNTISWKLLTVLLFTGIFAGLTKKTSIYITTVALFVLVFIPRRHQKMKLAVSALLPALLVLIVVPRCVYTPFNISSGNPAEAIAVPLQQVTKAVKDHPSEISQSDRQAITAVMNLDKAELDFTPQTAVAIKPSFKRNHVSKKQLVRFMMTWIKLGIRYPCSYISAVPYIWDAFVPGRVMVDGLYPIREGWKDLTQNVVLPSVPDHAYSWQQEHLGSLVYTGIRTIPPWNIIDDVSFYVLDIPLLALDICFIRKRYKNLFYLVPTALNIGIQCVIQTAEPRLSLGLLALFPLAVVTAWIE